MHEDGMNGAVRFEARLIGSLEEHARSIDTIFAAAGRDLGEGLQLFEALKERLTALSGQLSGNSILSAGAALGRLATDLRPLRQTLAEETRCLMDIGEHSTAAGDILRKLVEHIRLILILARLARIESTSIQGVEHDFGDFAKEIVELTIQAKHTIEACARDHDRLSTLLVSALTSQHEFEARYGAALWSLADKLSVTLTEVEERQSRGLALAEEAAARSGKIAMAVGASIIALQSGDSIRQRLEHAIAGLRLAGNLEDGRSGEDLPPPVASHARYLLYGLEAAQLEAIVAPLGEDAAAIEQNLLLLRNDTAGLVDLVRSLYGADGANAGSFMAQLEADLADASALLGKCNAARANADRVAQALTELLDTCQQTVEALAGTVSNIVLIGTNAGLRAARIGSNGRSLVVIAQELKSAADLISADSQRLPPIFERMQRASADLKRQDRLDAGHFSALDHEMSGALTVMRMTAANLASELDRLMREGDIFGDVVDRARLGFSGAGATAEAIAAAAHALAGLSTAAPDVPAETVEQARDWVTGAVWPRYTMAVERTLHTAVIPGNIVVASFSDPLTAADEVDALLF